MLERLRYSNYETERGNKYGCLSLFALEALLSPLFISQREERGREIEEGRRERRKEREGKRGTARMK